MGPFSVKRAFMLVDPGPPFMYMIRGVSAVL